MRTVSVWIDVDSRSGVPIYVQVVEQMRHAIEFGGLVGGERLPTVRRLAGDLAIAPNTIVKAYNEPTSGLDPVARRAFLKVLVGDVAAEGRTVFSTHLLSELVWHGPLDGVDLARVAICVGPGGNLLRRVQKRAGQPGGYFRDRVPGLLCPPRLR